MIPSHEKCLFQNDFYSKSIFNSLSVGANMLTSIQSAVFLCRFITECRFSHNMLSCLQKGHCLYCFKAKWYVVYMVTHVVMLSRKLVLLQWSWVSSCSELHSPLQCSRSGRHTVERGRLEEQTEHVDICDRVGYCLNLNDCSSLFRFQFLTFF